MGQGGGGFSQQCICRLLLRIYRWMGRTRWSFLDPVTRFMSGKGRMEKAIHDNQPFFIEPRCSREHNWRPPFGGGTTLKNCASISGCMDIYKKRQK